MSREFPNRQNAQLFRKQTHLVYWLLFGLSRTGRLCCRYIWGAEIVQCFCRTYQHLLAKENVCGQWFSNKEIILSVVSFVVWPLISVADYNTLGQAPSSFWIIQNAYAIFVCCCKSYHNGNLGCFPIEYLKKFQFCILQGSLFFLDGSMSWCVYQFAFIPKTVLIISGQR
mgnify:CR=1 FL=1